MVNVGAAGTFVVRARMSRSVVEAALARELPFVTAIVTCEGARIINLIREDPLAEYAGQVDVTRFVSTLGKTPNADPELPIEFGEGRSWLVRLVGRSDRFVLGVYRRDPKTINHLGRVDKMYDGPITTRNWNTITAIARVLDS